MEYLGRLQGIEIIESQYLMEKGEPVTVVRSWWERLFSRPWTPLVRTKTITPMVPHRGAVRLNATTVVMHPATLRQLRELLREGRT